MSEKDFKQEIREILIRDNSYPVDGWKSLILRHNRAKGKKEAYSKINDAIKNDVKSVYVYMKKERCLYVGIGNLKVRFKDHYKESYDKPKGRAKRWYDFFGARENQGEIRIFWKQMDYRKAKVIEKMLSYFLEPEFEKEEGIH
jgi:hypothetical protein